MRLLQTINKSKHILHMNRTLVCVYCLPRAYVKKKSKLERIGILKMGPYVLNFNTPCLLFCINS